MKNDLSNIYLIFLGNRNDSYFVWYSYTE